VTWGWDPAPPRLWRRVSLRVAATVTAVSIAVVTGAGGGIIDAVDPPSPPTRITDCITAIEGIETLKKDFPAFAAAYVKAGGRGQPLLVTKGKASECKIDPLSLLRGSR
jgi:hypothetical protein